jgi:Mannosyltransferase (PIG-V)
MRASAEISNVVLTNAAKSVKPSLVFLALLTYKIIYLLSISAAILIWPEKVNENVFHSDSQGSTPGGNVTFDSHCSSWDAAHYLFIAANGYEAGDSRCAFYPLFPLTIRYFSIITGGSQLVAGMILANLFSLAGWFIFFSMVRRRFGESTAKMALILLVAFPGALFFQFVYTESLFFLLLMLLLLGLQENCFWLAFASSFLLPLTRAVGIFCLFPLLWDLMTHSSPVGWVKLRSQIRWGKPSISTDEPEDAREKPISTGLIGRQRAWFLLLAPLCGWACYLLLMKAWTGNAFAGFDAQKNWGVQSIHNLFDPVHFVTQLVNPTSWHEFNGSLLDRCALILVINCFPLIWKLDKGWCVWAFFLGVAPAMSGTFVSYTRFASVVFPFFVAMAVFLNKPGLLFRRFRLVAFATFVTLQLILLWRFVNFRWAG